jgi:putative NADH-flavin reductase
MRVAVIGASGRCGRATVARALAAGHEVVAVVRSASSAPDGTTIAIADARDVAALTVAIAGADAVVTALGHVKDSADTTILRDGALALIAAMSSASVPRLVAVSAAGAYIQGDDPLSRYIAKPLVARLFGQAFADTRLMEDEVRTSTLDWTILRPSRLVSGPSGPTYRSGVDTAVKWHYDTRFDTVGRAAVDALGSDLWLRHAIFLTG